MDTNNSDMSTCPHHLHSLVPSSVVDAAFQLSSPEGALRDGPRKFFVLAAEVARGQFDPVAQWDAFVQALWVQLDAGFALSLDTEVDYPDMPSACVDDPSDPDVVVWDQRTEGG